MRSIHIYELSNDKYCGTSYSIKYVSNLLVMIFLFKFCELLGIGCPRRVVLWEPGTSFLIMFVLWTADY
jgi:hypothetical protein